jgi:P27 family predicted phage terminase small subunit
MRGRKPKPAHLRLIEGNPGKRALPKGVKIEPTEAPEPPTFIKGYAREEWDRIAPGLALMGMLTAIDTAALASYCQSYAVWRQATEAINKMAASDMLTGGLMIKTTNGNAIQNPLVGTANKAASDMVRYAAEFGMTPSARTRLNASLPGGTESKFHGLIGGQES